MIERLLAAERALDAGQLEVAERLYAQVEAADPRNAIAMTGRAKVARAQGDVDGARRHVTRALETDPDDQAARSLSSALAGPGPEPAGPAAAATPVPAPVPVPSPATTAVRAPSGPPAAEPRPSIRRSIRRFLARLVGR